MQAFWKLSMPLRGPPPQKKLAHVHCPELLIRLLCLTRTSTQVLLEEKVAALEAELRHLRDAKSVPQK
jgi:hypothetical protein